ncbi:TetR/AcrR family transcriptional regulator [Paenibacillus paeoniae]|uniref:TetR/AcrR family transcriptional regulator n=1 Tax=Paenibacillus paeoniae TaxID=2292705 RepID=A0A371P6E6_9BACL|nr:TetR/AcrR family transcriptional regulator [Paenibacillus paeoniae]REK71527.1 TetR/AcrR family transcriptional regulator [Paenibacillus paeoniae]
MSPRNPEKDRQMREKRMQHILDSALKVMAVHGFQLTSIQDIAKEAKVSVGTVYHYFESKEEIFSEVLRKGQTNYGRNVAAVAVMEVEPLQKLRVIASTWLAASSTNWAFTILMHTARLSKSTPPELKRAITERFTANLKPVASIMEEGMRQGTIVEGDSVQLAFYFVSLIQGLTMQRTPDYEVPVAMNVDAIIGLFEVKEQR